VLSEIVMAAMRIDPGDGFAGGSFGIVFVSPPENFRITTSLYDPVDDDGVGTIVHEDVGNIFTDFDSTSCALKRSGRLVGFAYKVDLARVPVFVRVGHKRSFGLRCRTARRLL